MLYATAAHIDLDALATNARHLRTLAGDRAVCAAVKANAYGHGAVEVSRVLESQGLADWLAVATVPEAIELRGAGITLPILKLSHCFPDELAAAIEADVTLAVVDEASIDAAQAAAEAAGRVVPVHLALDTGMRRIGCTPEDAPALAERVADASHLHLQGIGTHFPVSDTTDGVAFTRAQKAKLLEVAATINEARRARGLDDLEHVHAANSGGLLGHDLDGLTMVRPGIALYGCYPDAETPRSVPLQQVFSLVSKVSFVKKVPAGETVGYGRTWRSDADHWVATVPIGYADGYSRLNSNRGRVLINGASYPLAGRVCMDQIMIDLGDNERGVQAGDDVVLIGRSGDESISTDEMAALMGTINYEVTCLIAPRVTRVY